MCSEDADGAPFLGCLFFLYSCLGARKSVLTFEMLPAGQGQSEESSLCVTPFFPDVPLYRLYRDLIST